MSELYLPPIPRPKPTRSKETGRYLKGHVPANKGKTWDEYVPKKSQRKCRKGWKNLDKYRPTVRPDTAGRSRKAVVAITDEGQVYCLGYVGAAARWLEKRTGESCSRENVGRCCRYNASGKVLPTCKGKGRGKGSPAVNTDHRYKGIRFYFESDIEIWKDKVNK